MIQKPYKMRPHCCWIAEVCAFKKRASHMLFPKFRVWCVCECACVQEQSRVRVYIIATSWGYVVVTVVLVSLTAPYG